jgi:hypothetical protein
VAHINLAGNQLLSRAALVGWRAPPWDTNQAPLRGYFEAVYDIRLAALRPGIWSLSKSAALPHPA